MSVLAGITDTIIIVLFVILILIFFFGSNWRVWYTSRQLKYQLRKIKLWKNYGIKIIKAEIGSFLPSSITTLEMEEFIEKIIEFFVIPPTEYEKEVMGKLRYLISQKNIRYRQLIKDFLPKITQEKLYTLTSLIQATSELNELAKEISHNIILGKKIKSSLHILQMASEINKYMLKAQSYRIALDSFRSNVPIGDSIGPLSVINFIDEQKSNNLEILSNRKQIGDDFLFYEFDYKQRNCILLKAKGPFSNVGTPGLALEKLFSELKEKNSNISLLITIDAYLKRESETSGMVNQGIGISAGGEGQYFIDKYQIEKLTLEHKPKIPIESIVIKESMTDAVSPLTKDIENSLVDILLVLKKIIRSQTKPKDTVIIIGVGNSLGVKDD